MSRWSHACWILTVATFLTPSGCAPTGASDGGAKGGSELQIGSSGAVNGSNNVHGKNALNGDASGAGNLGGGGIAGANPTAPGDMNCDGRVDEADLNEFVMAVVFGAAPSCTMASADMNHDGRINNFDLELFATKLRESADNTPPPPQNANRGKGGKRRG